jgi:thiamine biosynthesis lipoprotein
MINRPTGLALGLSALVAAGCREPPPGSVTLSAAGVSGTVTVAQGRQSRLAPAVDVTYNTLNRVLRSLDARDPKSDLSRINSIAGSARWPIPSDMFGILDLVNHYSRELDGALDVTLSPLAELWGLAGDHTPEEPPSQDVVNSLRKNVGQDKVILSDDGTIAFFSPSIRLDLGALAVGYAMDLSIVNLRRQGITNVLLTVGSGARGLGNRARGSPWTIPLVDPWGREENLGTVSLPPSTALVVVRLYESSVQIGQRLYGHVIDPRTGCPAEGTAAVAVLGPTATMASALAQAMLVLGLDEAPKALGRFPRCEALIVPDRQPLEIWATEKFAGRFAAATNVAARVQRIVRTSATDTDSAEDESR